MSGSIPFFLIIFISTSNSRGLYFVGFQKNTFTSLSWILLFSSFPKIRTNIFTCTSVSNNKGDKGHFSENNDNKNHFKMLLIVVYYSRTFWEQIGTDIKKTKQTRKKNVNFRKILKYMRNIHRTCPNLEVNNIHLVFIYVKTINFTKYDIIFVIKMKRGYLGSVGMRS